MNIIITIILSYLIGCFSSAYIIGKFVKGIDIRTKGSGNAGTTNALRVMGIRVAIFTFLLDVLKGVVGVLIGRALGGYNLGLVGGLFTVIGHNWPVFLDFKGGKGIATSLGVFLTINIYIALISVVVGLSVAFIFNYVSLGSLCFLLTNLIISLVWDLVKIGNIFNIKILVIMVLVILGFYRHEENIDRLVKGEENKFRGD